MQLDGLTQEQVKIVDRLWEMQTNDECTRHEKCAHRAIVRQRYAADALRDKCNIRD